MAEGKQSLISTCNNHDVFRDHGGDDEEGDPIVKAEEDFWNSISQARKDITAKEKKRAEASGGKSQPTPIPEEGVEPGALSDAKPEVDEIKVDIIKHVIIRCLLLWMMVDQLKTKRTLRKVKLYFPSSVVMCQQQYHFIIIIVM